MPARTSPSWRLVQNRCRHRRTRIRLAAPAVSPPPWPAASCPRCSSSGGAFALGWVGNDAPTSAAVAPGPALVGAKQTGDVAAIYAAARNSVVSIKTSDGSGTGFVVKADGTIVTNAHVVGTESTVQVQFADDETVTGRVGGVDRSSDLAVVKISTSRDAQAARAGRLERRQDRAAGGRDRVAVRALADDHRGHRERHRPPHPGA